jgi:hypothetical protein
MISLIGSFVLKHLPAIILAALITIIAWQFYSITSERDEAVRGLNNLQRALDIAKAENAGKLATLKAEGIRNQAKEKQQHIADIQHIGNQYGKVINNDKDVISYRNAVINKLREQQASSGSNGVPKDDAGQFATSDGHPNPAGRSEEYWQHAYSGAQEYIQVLKEAGAMCAADYNACHQYVKDEQGRLGIEN